MGDWNLQSNKLASLLVRKKTEFKAKDLCKNRENFWVYYFELKGEKIIVCRNFLINLYKIIKHRIHTLQKKIISGSIISDNRGLNNKRNKINNNVWNSLNQFLAQVLNPIIDLQNQINVILKILIYI